MPKYSMSRVAGMVHAYLARAQNDKNVEVFPFDEKATFQIIGGSKGEQVGRKELNPCLYYGSFLDVVVLAVQQNEFKADYRSVDDTGDTNAGYVVKWEQLKIHVTPARAKGLDRLLKRLAKQDEKKKPK